MSQAIVIKCPASDKRVYGSRQAAVDAARACEAQTGRPYRIYPCPGCGWWHVTSHYAPSKWAGR